MKFNYKTAGEVKYGRLTTVQWFRDHGKTFAACKCDCGGEATVSQNNLQTGNTVSCGCVQDDTRTKHGRCRTRAYRSWQHMKDRCKNPNNAKWQSYGGRGITVCQRWLGADGFTNFFSDMGEPPPEMTIDRIDNDGHYEPSNCRWASRKTQQRNRRVNKLLTNGGETKPLVVWAEEVGMKPNTLLGRLRDGWSAEDAIGSPVDERFGNKRVGG